MGDISKFFWKASIEELKRGYIYSGETEEFICLVCGQRFLKGVIYPAEKCFYEAEKFTQMHIAGEHSSMFECLIGLDKKITGLTDLQGKLLRFFYRGMSDNEIVSELGGGSTSTIRNHRFTLKEKMKQARVFLAIMEMVEASSGIDQRNAMAGQESEKILKAYFKKGLNGPLSGFPKKEKRKIAILNNLIKMFEAKKQYTEKEVNEILKSVYPDYVTLRRCLIEYGFMDRYPDGSKYWVKVKNDEIRGD